MSARKTTAQLQAELDAANKRCADLADALVKALMAQPVIVPYAVPFYPQPALPVWPTYPGVTYEFIPSIGHPCPPYASMRASNTDRVSS